MQKEPKKGKYRDLNVVKSYLDELISLDYREKPVDVLTFIKDDYFLGKATENGKAIYDVWKHALKEIFENDNKFLVVLTGAIGTGKTTVADIGIAYIKYHISCLKNPWSYFGLADSGKMTVCFFNLTKTLGDSRGFSKLQSLITKSPWFLNSRGAYLKGKTDQQLWMPLFDYVLASPYARGFGVIGEDVIAALLDELDSPTDSIKQKARVLKAYEATVRRFESRFVINGYSLGRMFLAASKQDELSFMDTFITKMQSSGKVLVYDIPLWEAKPKRYYSGVTFSVAVGDGFTMPKILNSESIVEAQKSGFKIISVPAEFRDEFERDLVGALRDLAGVTVAGVRKRKLIASERFIKECFDETKEDPVSIPTISIGLRDPGFLLMYLDVKKFRMPKSVPRFLHCDIAVTGDALGLAMSGIKGWEDVNVEKEDGTFAIQRLPVIETDFIMRLVAKEGDRIPLNQINKLVLDLKGLGYNIFFTCDLRLMSENMFQVLIKAGVKAESLSVDKSPDAYNDFKDIIYDKRWICHVHNMLFFEIKNLEYDPVKNFVDHPEEVVDIEILDSGDIKEIVLAGSKDVADAVAGSIESCLKNSNAFMDTESMIRAIKKLTASDSLSSKVNPLVFKDAGGKEIIGVKHGNKIDILKKLFNKLQ